MLHRELVHFVDVQMAIAIKKPAMVFNLTVPLLEISFHGTAQYNGTSEGYSSSDASVLLLASAGELTGIGTFRCRLSFGYDLCHIEAEFTSRKVATIISLFDFSWPMTIVGHGSWMDSRSLRPDALQE